MKTISVSVSEDDYTDFQKLAAERRLPVARLIRQAMAHYLETVLAQKPRLTELPVFVGHRPLGPPPDRAEIYEEEFGDRS
jgi:hypothetical protein